MSTLNDNKNLKLIYIVSFLTRNIFTCILANNIRSTDRQLQRKNKIHHNGVIKVNT